MEGWVKEQLEVLVGKKRVQDVLALVVPEVRKDILREVAAYLEVEWSKRNSELSSSERRWVFIARLKAGLLP